jgi:hypothetical protein
MIERVTDMRFPYDYEHRVYKIKKLMVALEDRAQLLNILLEVPQEAPLPLRRTFLCPPGHKGGRSHQGGIG